MSPFSWLCPCVGQVGAELSIVKRIKGHELADFHVRIVLRGVVRNAEDRAFVVFHFRDHEAQLLERTEHVRDQLELVRNKRIGIDEFVATAIALVQFMGNLELIFDEVLVAVKQLAQRFHASAVFIQNAALCDVGRIVALQGDSRLKSAQNFAKGLIDVARIVDIL